MGEMLASLLRLQSIERQVITVRNRLRVRENALATQQGRINQLQSDWKALHDQSLQRRKESDTFELDLKQREEKISSLRTSLNTAKTNKEYAAILTQLNTIKADNASLEEKILKIMQEVEGLSARAAEMQSQIEKEQQRLAEVTATNGEEIARLSEMLGGLSSQRDEAARSVGAQELSLFERIAKSLGGDAMAVVEMHGKRAPYEYVCGGCFMALNAEHANALRTRDEIRTCDCCGRILYLDQDHANAEQQQQP